MWRRNLPLAAAGDLAVNPERDDGAPGGDQDAVNIDARDPAEAEDIGGDQAADDRADDAEHEVRDHALPALVNELAGDITRDQSEYDPAYNAHGKSPKLAGNPPPPA